MTSLSMASVRVPRRTVEVLHRIHGHPDGDDHRWFGPMEHALGRD
jgi:hypothetical protein